MDESIVVKFISIIPGGLSLLAVIVRIATALGSSQKKRISKILQGAKKNVANELGFMHKVEKEVNTVKVNFKFIESI